MAGRKRKPRTYERHACKICDHYPIGSYSAAELRAKLDSIVGLLGYGLVPVGAVKHVTAAGDVRHIAASLHRLCVECYSARAEGVAPEQIANEARTRRADRKERVDEILRRRGKCPTCLQPIEASGDEPRCPWAGVHPSFTKPPAELVAEHAERSDAELFGDVTGLCPECGATLADVAGPDYRARLCTECDRDRLADLEGDDE